MSIQTILEQAKALSVAERKELTKLLIDTLDVGETAIAAPKTGEEIVAMIEASEPVAFVDEHIEDPVEWVAEQRRKEEARLKPCWGKNPND